MSCEENNICYRRKIYEYCLIILIGLCCISAIVISFVSISIIQDNNHDINNYGLMRAKIEEFNNKVGCELLPSNITSRYICRNVAEANLLYINNLLTRCNNENLDINCIKSISTLKVINKNYKNFKKLLDQFYKNYDYSLYNSLSLMEYNTKNYKSWHSIIVYYHYNIINKIKYSTSNFTSLNTYLYSVVDSVERNATNKSLIVVYVTISISIMQIIGLVFYVRNIHNNRYTEKYLLKLKTNLINKNTEIDEKNIENKVQSNLINMLSHDMKGSATNIVGELTLLQEYIDNTSNDELKKTTVNDYLSRGIFESIHIQKCIRSLKIKSDILENKEKIRYTSINLYKLFEIFNYKYNKILTIKIPKDFVIYSNEDILYNIFQNAIKNAVKHGKINGNIELILYNENNVLEIILINKPGKNNETILKLQEEKGLNFIFNNDISNDNVGTLDSTFKGLCDMKLLSNTINSEVSLVFSDDKVVFKLIFPEKYYNQTVDSVSIDILPGVCCDKDIYFLGIDDQNISRIFLFNLAKKLDINIDKVKLEPNDLKGNMYRDEEYLKIFGRTSKEVILNNIVFICKKWENKASIVVLDQNIDFTSSIIYGTDITKILRNNGFNGVILIRSANDNDSDENIYIDAGADGVLSKTITIKDCNDIVERWKQESIRRIL